MLRVVPYREFRVRCHVSLSFSSLTLITSTHGDMKNLIFYVVASDYCGRRRNFPYKGESVETTPANLMLAVSRAQERAKTSNLHETEQPRDTLVSGTRRSCRCGMILLPPKG